MPIYDHFTEFGGKSIIDWEPGTPSDDPEGTSYRLSVQWDEAEEGVRWVEKFAHFLDDPASGRVTGLVVGPWESPNEGDGDVSRAIVAAIAAARDRLPRLTALFLGDIIVEESEISWIEQCDVSPLLAAYPQLEDFGVRGGNGLSLGALRHDRLRSLIVESGGLPRSVVREVAAAELPALEHLELWLGTEQYGGDATIDDLTDAIAAAVAVAPIVRRIAALDLSLGVLTDDGARTLLASPAIARLQKLDLHHHFCSEAVAAQLAALQCEVDLGEPQEADEYDGKRYRYVAVGE